MAYEKSKEKNLEFLKNLTSPVIDAYQRFLCQWNPEEEIKNPILLTLGKNFDTAKYIIVVEDFESREYALHEDAGVKEKWESFEEAYFHEM